MAIDQKLVEHAAKIIDKDVHKLRSGYEPQYRVNLEKSLLLEDFISNMYSSDSIKERLKRKDSSEALLIGGLLECNSDITPFSAEDISKTDINKKIMEYGEHIVAQTYNSLKNAQKRKKSPSLVIYEEPPIESMISAELFFQTIKNPFVLKRAYDAKSILDLKRLKVIDQYASLVFPASDSSHEITKFCEFKEGSAEYEKFVLNYYGESRRCEQSQKKMEKPLKSVKRILSKSTVLKKDILNMKNLENNLKDYFAEYKTIIKNPEIAKQLNQDKEKYSSHRKDIETWLHKTLKHNLDKELSSISTDVLSVKTLDEAILMSQTNYELLNELGEKYNIANLDSKELNYKLSTISDTKKSLKESEKIRNELSRVLKIIKKYNNIRNYKVSSDFNPSTKIIDEEKIIEEKIGSIDCRFEDTKELASTYIQESDIFRQRIRKKALSKKCLDRLARESDYVIDDVIKEDIYGSNYEQKYQDGTIATVRKIIPFSQIINQKNDISDYSTSRIKRNNKNVYKNSNIFRNLFYATAAGLLLSSVGLFSYLSSTNTATAGNDLKPEKHQEMEYIIEKTEIKPTFSEKISLKKRTLNLNNYVESQIREYKSNLIHAKVRLRRANSDDKSFDVYKHYHMVKSDMDNFMQSDRFKQYKRMNQKTEKYK